jgi:hypothetical protein
VNIHLHVDLLVLEGLPVEAAQGDRVKAGVEAELTRLLAGSPVGPGLRAGGARPSIPGLDILLSGHDTPATLGRRIGQAVYGGINR